jgi:hypothetical protein
MTWDNSAARPVALAELGQKYRRYRLADPEAESALVASLRRWGQLSALVACEREGQWNCSMASRGRRRRPRWDWRR